MKSLPDLHDATLLSLSFDWQEALVAFQFKVGRPKPGELVLMAGDVTGLKWNHKLPWGPSKSVNTVATKPVASGIIFTIEMQSGDLIETICSQVWVKTDSF